MKKIRLTKTKRFPFQQKAIDKIQRFKGKALLASEMGLGKTPTALWWAIDHLKDRKGPIIVVCPASLKWNWANEVRKHTRLEIEILEGMKPRQMGLHRSDVIIINYDILGPWVPTLKALKPSLVIGDEVHYVCNRKAKRSKHFKSLCKRSKKKILISGTPLTNRPAELWNILNIVRPDLFPSFFSYAMEYCKPKKTRFGWDYSGADNLDELHSILRKNVMIRHLKKNVLDQLPEKIRNIVLINLSKKARAEYNEALHRFIRWIKKVQGNAALKRMSKAIQLAQTGHLKRLAAELKMAAIYEWLDNYLQDTDKKLIVFGHHRKIIEALHERYKDKSVLVHGGVKGQLRQEAFDSFNTSKKLRFLFGNMMAAGVGWSARKTNEVAFVELDWRPSTHKQAEDRIHGLYRGKEGSNCFYWYLIAKDTIEQDLLNILQRKAEISDQVLDGSTKETEFGILNELLQTLLSKGTKK